MTHDTQKAHADTTYIYLTLTLAKPDTHPFTHSPAFKIHTCRISLKNLVILREKKMDTVHVELIERYLKLMSSVEILSVPLI